MERTPPLGFCCYGRIQNNLFLVNGAWPALQDKILFVGYSVIEC